VNENDISKQILSDELAILQELSDNFVVDLRNFEPLGSIFNIGLYQIPPQPKKVKQWVIKQSKKLFYSILYYHEITQIKNSIK
jgi:hypothetical protein